MRAGFDLNTFEDKAAAIEAAARFSREAIEAGIALRGAALVLLSGGSTPLPLYRALSAAPIDWPRVTALVVDERWVAPDHPSSNEGAIRAAFATGPSAAMEVVGLKTGAASPRDAVGEVERRVAALRWPADLCILGMGPDGHTASWFPNADGLADALEDEGPRIAAIKARHSDVTGELVDRITLTASAIQSARRILLLMTGEEKRRVYEKARRSGPVNDMPVRALFGGPRAAFHAIWAP